MRSPFILLLVLFVCCVPQAVADSQSNYQKQIQQIGKEIKKISKNLNANKKLLKSEQHKLLEVEKNIKTLLEKSNKTELKITQQQQYIKEITQKIINLRSDQSDNLDSMKALVVRQYINGQPNYLKMLLNQQNPYAVGRLSHYYKYYQQAHSQKLDEVKQQLLQQEALQNKNQQAVAKLSEIKQRQAIQHQQLEEAQKKRKRVITRLDKKVESTSSRLKKLQQNRDRLNSLLKQLAEQAAKIRQIEQARIKEQRQQDLALKQDSNRTPAPRPIVKPVAGGFKKQKGRLKLPVQGKAQYKFGSRIAASGMRAEGILIEAQANQNVHSIFRGRVVFADWLKGYGLLLIVDHGDEHISLYGHNQLLYKKVGDMVKTDEIIAKVGITGGLKKPGVYFEIRHNASPINPSLWCE